MKRFILLTLEILLLLSYITTPLFVIIASIERRWIMISAVVPIFYLLLSFLVHYYDRYSERKYTLRKKYRDQLDKLHFTKDVEGEPYLKDHIKLNLRLDLRTYRIYLLDVTEDMLSSFGRRAIRVANVVNDNPIDDQMDEQTDNNVRDVKSELNNVVNDFKLFLFNEAVEHFLKKIAHVRLTFRIKKN